MYIDGAKWDASTAKTTASAIEFRVGTETVYRFDQPYAEDSSEVYGPDKATSGLLRVRKAGNNLYVEVRVPYAWLQTAVYPVTVDPTLTLQPDAAAGMDTMMYSVAANNNYGIRNETNIGWPGSTQRGLHRFDLSSITPGSTIVSAIMTLYCWNVAGANQPHPVSKALTQWYEGDKNAATPDVGVDGSTWNYRNHNGSVAWAGGAGGAAGRDWDTTALDTTTVTTAGYYTWDIAAGVTDWVSTPASNLGTWLLGTVSYGVNNFYSSDHVTDYHRPKLVIEYTEAASGGAQHGGLDLGLLGLSLIGKH